MKKPGLSLAPAVFVIENYICHREANAKAPCKVNPFVGSVLPGRAMPKKTETRHSAGASFAS